MAQNLWILFIGLLEEMKKKEVNIDVWKLLGTATVAAAFKELSTNAQKSLSKGFLLLFREMMMMLGVFFIELFLYEQPTLKDRKWHKTWATT